MATGLKITALTTSWLASGAGEASRDQYTIKGRKVFNVPSFILYGWLLLSSPQEKKQKGA